MSLFLGVALRPFIGLLVFSVIVIPVELFLAKRVPDCRLKAFLFDRTLHKRRPWVFTAWWLVIVGGGYLFIGLTFID